MGEAMTWDEAAAESKKTAASDWLYGSCECSNWCRANPQPITDKHHMSCSKYNVTIRVVKITHDGNSCIDADIANALRSLEDGDNYAYQVELLDMLEREYEILPEFTGF